MELLKTFIERKEDIWYAFIDHIYLSAVSILFAIVISVPLGILLTRYRKIAEPIIGVAAVIQTIPGLALLAFMLPLFGIGQEPAIIAFTLYALLPVLRNTYTGILGVDPSMIDAGKGMGMTSWQILFMVELPLSLPVIMAGIRTASVFTIGLAALAAFIGGGGLGELIVRGMSMNDDSLIMAGAIPAALLAILFDLAFRLLERTMTPRGLKV
ncbi:ABC transporter permease [Lihuaxuella thermophila]|uniref:Osmoprotectant transport system permease protein n=1 Tax=Lihuaxuella thermophila TaxID=1173111 RepID=A0A1H8AL08_9BACL|nr:ABC transporter permease [Lihuaxuella thermophila]SEM70217.1 osmoprotectant transport system permease protein [Lihuaxuella thermophila]